MSVMFVQTTKYHQTASATFIPIPELSLTLPEGAMEQALLILNVPSAQAVGESNFGTGGRFGVAVDGVALSAFADFNVPNGTGWRVPVTLVVAVPLAGKQQVIQALYRANPGATCRLGESPASLSAFV
jgi:hypothetical protein